MTVSNIQWHPSWQGAVEIEMKAMRTYLEYLHELGVTKAPVVLDTLIIKQDPDAPILNEMAEGFRTYNVTIQSTQIIACRWCSGTPPQAAFSAFSSLTGFRGRPSDSRLRSSIAASTPCGKMSSMPRPHDASTAASQ